MNLIDKVKAISDDKILDELKFLETGYEFTKKHLMRAGGYLRNRSFYKFRLKLGIAYSKENGLREKEARQIIDRYFIFS